MIKYNFLTYILIVFFVQPNTCFDEGKNNFSDKETHARMVRDGFFSSLWHKVSDIFIPESTSQSTTANSSTSDTTLNTTISNVLKINTTLDTKRGEFLTTEILSTTEVDIVNDTDDDDEDTSVTPLSDDEEEQDIEITTRVARAYPLKSALVRQRLKNYSGLLKQRTERPHTKSKVENREKQLPQSLLPNPQTKLNPSNGHTSTLREEIQSLSLPPKYTNTKIALEKKNISQHRKEAQKKPINSGDDNDVSARRPYSMYVVSGIPRIHKSLATHSITVKKKNQDAILKTWKGTLGPLIANDVPGTLKHLMSDISKVKKENNKNIYRIKDDKTGPSSANHVLPGSPMVDINKFKKSRSGGISKINKDKIWLHVDHSKRYHATSLPVINIYRKFRNSEFKRQESNLPFMHLKDRNDKIFSKLSRDSLDETSNGLGILEKRSPKDRSCRCHIEKNTIEKGEDRRLF